MPSTEKANFLIIYNVFLYVILKRIFLINKRAKIFCKNWADRVNFFENENGFNFF